MHELTRQACSFLFVPANRPERLLKALISGADMVIADWEDAVAPAHKSIARGAMAQVMADLPDAARACLLAGLCPCVLARPDGAWSGRCHLQGPIRLHLESRLPTINRPSSGVASARCCATKSD